ncbi:hypothetical protein [Streptosporangium sp. NPDC000396]|uniref:hypothetical protein n=1 Tax=Streptosporangium sp. NPDC000396 TaxID=3366185 RepID=UPI003685280A
MTLTTTRPTPPGAETVQKAPASRIGWVLAAGWVVHLLLRLWLARWRTGPVANPDETGYLLAARWLAGGAGGDMSGSTFYQGGYPLLLTPAFWFTHDPALAYRLVVGVGAVVGAALFPLGYLALRRLGSGSGATCALAFVATLLPATVFFGQFALADAVLPTLVLAWLLALDAFVRSGAAASGVLASVLAGYGFAVHLRGTVIFVVHLAMSVLLVAGRKVPRKAGLVAVAVAVMTGTAGYVLNAELQAALYPDGIRDLTGLLRTRVTSFDGQLRALSGALGQLWYLVVSTWGLAGAGLAAGVAAVVRRRAPLRLRVAATALLVTTAGIAYASSAALPDEQRVGNYVYGRYLACVAIAWALAGLAVLARTSGKTAARHALASAVLLAVTGTAAALYAGDRIRRYNFVAFDFPETSFLTGRYDALNMMGASAAAAGLLACFAVSVLSRFRVPLLSAALAVVNVLFAAVLAGQSSTPTGGGWIPPLHGGGVAVERGVDWRARISLAYHVWWTEIRRFDVTRESPPPGTCTVVVPWPDGREATESWPSRPQGWVMAGSGRPPRGWVAWSDPACAGRAP